MEATRSAIDQLAMTVVGVAVAGATFCCIDETICAGSDGIGAEAAAIAGGGKVAGDDGAATDVLA